MSLDIINDILNVIKSLIQDAHSPRLSRCRLSRQSGVLSAMASTEILSFSNSSRSDLKKIKEFVEFQRDFYKSENHSIPLLRYEYLGSRLLGMKGFFEQRNTFFKHGECQFFLAYRDQQIVGRCAAFIDENYNKHWKTKVGFFGQFECIDDKAVAKDLLAQAEAWLRGKGMSAMRGRRNFPMKE